jgi:hypothetical protein
MPAAPRAALLAAAAWGWSWGCGATARVEVGVRTTFDGHPSLRLGVSVGAGLSSGDGSLTQSVGYRYARSHSVTTTTRLLVPAGPVYVSGALDIGRAGFDVAPAFAIPLYRSSSMEKDTSLIPGSGRWTYTTDTTLLSVGLQLRVGRHDGVGTAGADLVIGFDGVSRVDAPD